MLLALCVGGSYALAMLLFYLCGYVVTNLGTFLVVHAVADRRGRRLARRIFRDWRGARRGWVCRC
jgi:NADH:ubiquinone oxidoreductase subunit 2 (subunit N)